MDEEPNFVLNGHAQKKDYMREDDIFFVKWLCANKRNKSVSTLRLGRAQKIIEIGPYISTKRSCAHKRTKSMTTLIFG